MRKLKVTTAVACVQPKSANEDIDPDEAGMSVFRG